MAFTKLAGKIVVDETDLADISHNINQTGPAQHNTDFYSKSEGAEVLVDIAGAGTDYALAVSTGDAAADPWLVLDGTTAPITPA